MYARPKTYKYSSLLITVAKLNTYLNFAGNKEEAFNFYKSVFGGEINYDYV